MPQVDLSTLGGQELRRLLDSSRRRGQAALSYQILQEMAARREQREHRTGPSLFAASRRGGEPRVIALDLGDPVAVDEDEAPPELHAAEPAAPEASWDEPAVETEAEVDAEPPLTLEPVAGPARKAKPPREPRPVRAPKPKPERAAPSDRTPRRSRWAAAGFIAGVAVGVVVGLGVSQEVWPTPSPAPAPLPVATALPPSMPVAAVTTPTPIPEAAPELPAPPPPPTAAEMAAETAPAAAPAPPVAAQPAPAPEAPVAEPAPTAATAGDCAAATTPADRTICQDPRLQRLQRELRQAYARALDAHEDRALLREHQLAWRDGRNEVSDPDRLAQLYEERIHKLDAATAEARRLR